MNNEQSYGGIVLGTLALVCGGISFIVCWWLSFIGILLSFLGLMFPKRALSAIGLGVSIISLTTNLVVLSSLGII